MEPCHTAKLVSEANGAVEGRHGRHSTPHVRKCSRAFTLPRRRRQNPPQRPTRPRVISVALLVQTCGTQTAPNAQSERTPGTPLAPLSLTGFHAGCLFSGGVRGVADLVFDGREHVAMRCTVPRCP